MQPIALLTVLLCLSSMPLAAQEGEAGWPIVERCVGEPTIPPEGWTFEGTIFTYKAEVGVRALNSEIGVPYFVAFADNHFHRAGEISPDGQWYAVPTGYWQFTWSLNRIYEIEYLLIYSTDPNRELLARIPWSGGNIGSDPYSILTWVDSQNIAIEKRWSEELFKIHLPDIEITPWGDEINPMTSAYSPDGTMVMERVSRELKNLTNLTTHEFIDAPAGYTYRSAPIWAFDSAIFAIFLGQENTENSQLALMDRSGKVLSIMYDVSSEDYFGDIDVSLVGHMAFMKNGRLFVANANKETIFDTCLSPHPQADQLAMDFIHWSPDGTQLAFELNEGILVLDIASWQVTKLWEDIGSVIAWRAD